MINAILSASVRQRWLVLFLTLVLAVFGGWQLNLLPIDVTPDITNKQVQINTVVPTLSPVEVEKRVTYPIETALAGLNGVERTRSFSRNGFSQVTAIFKEDADLYFMRQQVSERLAQARASLPDGAEPRMGPVSTGLGEVFHYSVEFEHPEGKGATAKDGEPGWQSDGSFLTDEGERLKDRVSKLAYLRTVQDWIVRPQLRTTTGVADVDSLGGYVKEFLVEPDAAKLAAFGISYADVNRALEDANLSVGPTTSSARASPTWCVPMRAYAPSMRSHAPWWHSARGSCHHRAGGQGQRGRRTAHRCSQPRWSGNRGGQCPHAGGREQPYRGAGRGRQAQGDFQDHAAGRGHCPDPGPFSARCGDRDHGGAQSDRGRRAGGRHPVRLAGQLACCGDCRHGHSLSLLFSAIGMNSLHISGNLMSLGALDFGLIIDGAVIIVENALRRLAHRQQQEGRLLTLSERLDEVIASSKEMVKPTVYGQLVIFLVFLPCLTFQGVEGKMFSPMVITLMLALASAFVLSLTFVPAMIAVLLRKEIAEKEVKIIVATKQRYRPLLTRAVQNPMPFVGAGVAVLALAAFAFTFVGREFMPTLDEQNLNLSSVRIPSTSIEQSAAIDLPLERAVLSLPEVKTVYSKAGTASLAADPMPPNASDNYIILKPRMNGPKA